VKAEGARVAGPRFTCVVELKLSPVISKVREDDPESTLVADIRVTEGTGLAMVKSSVLDLEPPGFVTPTGTIAAFTMSESGTSALSWLGLTKEVVRFALPNVTVAPETNPLPWRSRDKLELPATAVVVEIEVNAGTAFRAEDTLVLSLPPPQPNSASINALNKSLVPLSIVATPFPEELRSGGGIA
jgi:hypothetical protein